MYAKVDLENNKSSTYKHKPKYKKYRIANIDRPAINKIKKVLINKKERGCD